MKTATGPALSSLVREQIDSPSPIRQIMKMAERQNILAMGLDPAQVISFGGGWVNHAAPDEFRQAYQSIVVGRGALPQERRLHRHARRHGMPRADRALRGAPLRRAAARRRAHRHRHGQHAAHARSLPHAARSGRHGDAARSRPTPTTKASSPSSAPGVEDRAAARARSADVVVSAGDRSGRRRARVHAALRPASPAPGAVRRARQSDQPGRAAGARRGDARERTADAGAWLAIDFAYKCQYFQTPPAYYALVARRSSRTSSASTRTRSGRAAWAGASAGSKRTRRSSRRSSACSSAASSAPTRCRR